MNRNWISLLSVFAISACHAPNNDEAAAKRAWTKCLFELDKIEAARGRNLDDLDKGGSVARNQFMMDCLAVEDAGPTLDQISEMSSYAVAKKGRVLSDMSLNNGKR